MPHLPSKILPPTFLSKNVQKCPKCSKTPKVLPASPSSFSPTAPFKSQASESAKDLLMSKVGGSTNLWPICFEMKVIKASFKQSIPRAKAGPMAEAHEQAFNLNSTRITKKKQEDKTHTLGQPRDETNQNPTPTHLQHHWYHDNQSKTIPRTKNNTKKRKRLLLPSDWYMFFSVTYGGPRGAGSGRRGEDVGAGGLWGPELALAILFA